MCSIGEIMAAMTDFSLPIEFLETERSGKVQVLVKFQSTPRARGDGTLFLRFSFSVVINAPRARGWNTVDLALVLPHESNSPRSERAK
jgi:hypothetical protein